MMMMMILDMFRAATLITAMATLVIISLLMIAYHFTKTRTKLVQ